MGVSASRCPSVNNVQDGAGYMNVSRDQEQPLCSNLQKAFITGNHDRQSHVVPILRNRQSYDTAESTVYECIKGSAYGHRLQVQAIPSVPYGLGGN